MTLTPEMLEALRAELRAWSAETPEQDADQHFRIQMFHQRLHAAQHGREDAVLWAIDWYRSLAAKPAELELEAA